MSEEISEYERDFYKTGLCFASVKYEAKRLREKLEANVEDLTLLLKRIEDISEKMIFGPGEKDE